MSSDHPVDPSNAAQSANWDGDGGVFWAAHADRFDEGVAAYREPFLAAAAIADGATVLDVGCGNGRVTIEAARRAGSGSALGVDLSSEMLGVARRRAEIERVPNATFLLADAQLHPFPAESFDLVVSRHGTMFFGDPVAAFRNLARALRPGGCLVLLTWQRWEHNEWLRAFRTALDAGRGLPVPPTTTPSPLALSDPERVRSLLTVAGFSDVRLRGLTAPMYFGADPDDAFRFVSAQNAGTVRDLEPDDRSSALGALRASLVDHHLAGGVYYESAAWLVEARRP
jgi:SAM-dependent methyltransferase